MSTYSRKSGEMWSCFEYWNFLGRPLQIKLGVVARVSSFTSTFQAEKSSELFKLRQRESELHSVIQNLKELNCGGKQQHELPTYRGDNWPNSPLWPASCGTTERYANKPFLHGMWYSFCSFSIFQFAFWRLFSVINLRWRSSNIFNENSFIKVLKSIFWKLKVTYFQKKS